MSLRSGAFYIHIQHPLASKRWSYIIIIVCYLC